MTETPRQCRFMAATALGLYVLSATSGVFLSGMWAWYGIGGALILSILMRRSYGVWPRPERQMTLFVFTALAVIAVENYFSSQPVISWRLWMSLVTIFLPLLLLSNPDVQTRSYHTKLITVTLIASVASALVLGTELILGGPLAKIVNGSEGFALAHYNRGLSYLVMLAFPLAAGLRAGVVPLRDKHRVWAIALFIAVLLYPTSLTESRSAKLALLLAFATIFLAEYWPVLTKRLLTVALVLSSAWPFAAQYVVEHAPGLLARLPASWGARMEIWDYMSYRIMERPLLGWGLGTAHTLDFTTPHSSNYVFVTFPASHPHNVMTELWVELGLPGLALGLIFGFMMLDRATRLDAKIRPFAMGAWVAGFCLCLIAFNFWTDSIFGNFALVAFAFSMLNWNLESENQTAVCWEVSSQAAAMSALE